MTPGMLHDRFRALAKLRLPRPGSGGTPQRLMAVFAAGREDLSLAKLIEAHWDAVAILEEAGKEPARGDTYAVWASEAPGAGLTAHEGQLHGSKAFCSGAALVDRALISAGSQLIEIHLKEHSERLRIDESPWQTDAFRMTRTATLHFDAFPVATVIAGDHWYTQRPGFWQGACSPAAAWAGGAAGLLDYAARSKRDDPHSLAHRGGMYAAVAAMQSLLDSTGREIDRAPGKDAMPLALALRHTVEQMCTDVLRRFARSLGPAPLALDAEVARRYAELDLYLRQSHAERDLEALGRCVTTALTMPPDLENGRISETAHRL